MVAFGAIGVKKARHAGLFYSWSGMTGPVFDREVSATGAQCFAVLLAYQ